MRRTHPGNYDVADPDPWFLRAWRGGWRSCFYGGGSSSGALGVGRIVRTPWTFTLLLGTTISLLGCSRTVTGGYEDSPDGKYRVWIRNFGAYGHAFTDRTRKIVRIRLVGIIGAKHKWEEKLLFTKEYHFQCSDVMVDTSWDKEDNLNAVIYDYAPGVYWEDARKAGSPSNYIATVSLILDKQTGTVHEKK